MIRYEDDLRGDAAAIALAKLQAGEIDDDFRGIVQELTVTNEQPALTEGTLLIVGASLHSIKQFVKGSQAGQEEDIAPAAGYRNAHLYLAFVTGEIMRNGLRPIGREILAHCVELSVDEEMSAALTQLQGFDQNAPSAN